MTRRQFLATAVATSIGAVLAACGAAIGRSPTPVASPSGTAIEASPTPLATPSPTPDLRGMIGQMLLVGFRGLTVAEAPTIAADIRHRGLGGVLLFDRDLPSGTAIRNVASPAQLATLAADLQALATTPLIIAVDQEGGAVARLGPDRGFPATVSAAALGERDDVAYTTQHAAEIAATLRQAGINLNLAPVVDVNRNPSNPIIGAIGRSFSADPAVVAEQAQAFIDAHRAAGIRTAIKHFPGHGSSTGDTHAGVVDVTDTWDDVELEPYRSLLAAGAVDAVLTAHVFNARLDAEYPATLSAATIGGLLRGELGYSGLVISDDMQMGAIRDAFGYADAVRLAILAGVDMLTIGNQLAYEEGIVATTIDLVEGMVRAGEISEARIAESAARIEAFKAER